MPKEHKINAGDQAPDFTLKDQNGEDVALSSFTGSPVVLYFYPKDNTPGCTREACAFRDDYVAFKQANAVVIGVSPDSAKSHVNFISKYKLPFLLLSDTKKDVLKAYGAWGVKKMFGKESEGVIRSTFLIDAIGKIAKAWHTVKVDGHAEIVLKELEKLGKSL